MIAFVFRAVPKVAGMLRERVMKGELIYLGRSAGGMVVGANAAFSSEPNPDMIESVLDKTPTGLALLPKCIIKPHFRMAAHEAYAEALEQLTGQHVVRVPNGVALACQSGSCNLVGQAAKSEDTSFGDEAGMAHLASFFKATGSLRQRSRSAPRQVKALAWAVHVVVVAAVFHWLQ